jgi:D-sedoheptulose 7-phosphate isomerase
LLEPVDDFDRSVEFIRDQMHTRNRLSSEFFARESARLAEACQAMAERFARGGRLLTFGRGQYATDAQHVEVEFVHPVIVGKRALPALDLSAAYAHALPAMLGPDDIVMVFGPPAGDEALQPFLEFATEQGAQTFALPGNHADYAVAPNDIDPFIHQELIEILYHTLWETVHVFLEHREVGHGAGAAGFLYPFLSADKQDMGPIRLAVAASIEAKAQADSALRLQLAREAGKAISNAAVAILERVRTGAKLILFGNGGSGTDANDWALDCIASPKGYPAIPAVSLANAPACLSAVANDIGADSLFTRPLIAHARAGDVAIGISTSGAAPSVINALGEARQRGLLTVALLGCDGGEINRRGLADHNIIVRSDYIPRIQEVHASAYHVLLDLMATLS